MAQVRNRIIGGQTSIAMFSSKQSGNVRRAYSSKYFTYRNGQLVLWVDTLSKEQIEDYAKAFTIFDKDGNGEITIKEVGAVMRSLGRNPTEEELEDIINEADFDGSGSIDFPEFLTMMAKNEIENEKYLLHAFRVFDKTGSGIISAKEIRKVMCKLSLSDDLIVNLSHDEINDIMNEITVPGTDDVNYEETFMKMIQTHI